jgi:SAM-dependent methyltransferase
MTPLEYHEGGATPELLDLMDHEKVIEQGLNTFIDVGNALLAIREGKKYRAAGYSTFESYCQQRWQLSRSTAYQLMDAASTASVLSANADKITPVNEAQVRPLAPLARNDPQAAAEVWAEAVEEAGGQPTAAQVKAAADRRLEKKRHPAPFSDPILDAVAEQLTEVGTPTTVVDPFAGTGRVHELRERAGVIETIGIEIEPEWADSHPDTRQGDALRLSHEVGEDAVDAIVTSPTYGNRMADHHDAKDDSVRHTYKHTLGRDLDPNNSGQMHWGEQYRAFHRQAWSEAVKALKPGGTLTINIKNHMRAGVEQRVVEWHLDTLMHDFGLRLVALNVVATSGLRAGANANNRTPVEFVATLRKPA